MNDAIESIAGAAGLAAVVGFWFLVCRKAGYSKGRSLWMAIGLLVPLVNIGILVHFMSTTWPIQMELARLRFKTGIASPVDAQILMAAALRMEGRGEVSAAIDAYAEIARSLPSTEFARDSEAAIRSLRAKTGQPDVSTHPPTR